MYYDKFFKRADLRAIEAYIRDGSDLFEAFNEDSASTRISQCEKNINAAISENIQNSNKQDDIMSVIFNQINTYEELAFEAGFLCGAKVVLQAIDRLNKLS